MNLAQATRELRTTLALTQQAFADRLDVSLRSVAHYERGRPANVEALQRLTQLAREAGRPDLVSVFSGRNRPEEDPQLRAEATVKGGVKVSHLGGGKGDHWGGAKRRRGAVLFLMREESRRWESGKPAFGFPLFHPPSSPELWECGNLAVFWRDFQGARGKSGKPALGFPHFPQPRHFHSSSFG